ncbi:MAG: RNA-directed DNA polymerase, partial [Kiritimatiellales bacterium]
SCQITADQQTNGLHIGPHTSNVISEIILTKVDAVLLEKGYRRVVRHIDDYRFFARDHEDAEKFIRELSLQLREYELHINEGKTRIVPLPQPVQEDWVRELNSFRFSDEELVYSEVRLFLDLALRLVEETGKASVLNYAIQRIPARLNDRAKQMFAREAVNLALRYPYLAPVLDTHLFQKHEIDDNRIVEDFCCQLLEIGIQRVYPDTIAHALYYAIKFDIELNAEQLLEIVPINDCISLVMLWEYAERYELLDIQSAVRAKADELKASDRRDADMFWLLIYEVWPAQDLRRTGQGFLANLKESGFSFVQFNSDQSEDADAVMDAEDFPDL